MDRDDFEIHVERLTQSTDPYELAESARILSDTPQLLAARLALLLSQEREQRIELEVIVEEKDRQISRDELGLERRPAFDFDLLTALARIKRYPETHMAVAIVDADSLKEINDTMGHFAGDRFLQVTAAGISSELRAGDKLYRTGGDEFAGIFYDMDPEAAEAFQNRINHRMEQEYEVLAQEFADDEQILPDFDIFLQNYTIPFSFSIGMAFITPEDTIQSLTTRADKAMYEQKRQHKKRNKVFRPIE